MKRAPRKHDAVNHPRHYTSHKSGIECIEITAHMGFNLGNAFKYVWRAGLKTDDATEDLNKALWYAEREMKQPCSGVRRFVRSPGVLALVNKACDVETNGRALALSSLWNADGEPYDSTVLISAHRAVQRLIV